MSFQSARFFVFLIVCLFLYYAVPKRWKNLFLLLASWFFYSCAGTAYFVLLVVVSAISYVVADVIGRAKTKAVQTTMLVLGLVMLLGNLCFFKYYDWFVRQLAIAASNLGSAYIPPDYGLAVPLGISFYTFVLSGYLIDVYQRKREPERNFVKLALFASFFPLVSSGPVERSTGLLPQFDRPAPFQYDAFCQGASRILWGFFKKFVVADTLAVVVNRVFLDVTVHTGPYLLLAALFYSYQLYCDFSGYSDIAIGMARLFGFDVIENFRRPFAARSFSDLWRRWHISLTSWFRQYLYFPLGGSRKGTIRTYLNILLIFLVSGIWHGTGLNFAIWGPLEWGLYGLGKSKREPAGGAGAPQSALSLGMAESALPNRNRLPAVHKLHCIFSCRKPDAGAVVLQPPCNRMDGFVPSDGGPERAAEHGRRLCNGGSCADWCTHGGMGRVARRKRRMQRGRLDLSAAVCTKDGDLLFAFAGAGFLGQTGHIILYLLSVLTEGWHETFFKRGAVLSSVRNSDCGCQFLCRSGQCASHRL